VMAGTLLSIVTNRFSLTLFPFERTGYGFAARNGAMSGAAPLGATLPAEPLPADGREIENPQ
jgi:hypothetical protein